MASPEAVANQDNANSLQDPSQPLFFAPRPMIKLKYQQAPKGEILNVTNEEEVCYPPRELLAFSNLYRQIQRTCMRMDTKCVE